VNTNPDTNVESLMHPVRLSSCQSLGAFLSLIQIPYLLPGDIISEEICGKLDGLCQFGKLNGLCQIGKCNRFLDSYAIGMEFDLIYINKPT